MKYRFRYVRGHIEVFDASGRFVLSADTVCEAMTELEGEVQHDLS